MMEWPKFFMALVTGAAEHAAVDAEPGRPRRMPRERRSQMLSLLPPEA